MALRARRRPDDHDQPRVRRRTGPPLPNSTPDRRTERAATRSGTPSARPGGPGRLCRRGNARPRPGERGGGAPGGPRGASARRRSRPRGGARAPQRARRAGRGCRPLRAARPGAARGRPPDGRRRRRRAGPDRADLPELPADAPEQALRVPVRGPARDRFRPAGDCRRRSRHRRRRNRRPGRPSRRGASLRRGHRPGPGCRVAQACRAGARQPRPRAGARRARGRVPVGDLVSGAFEPIARSLRAEVASFYPGAELSAADEATIETNSGFVERRGELLLQTLGERLPEGLTGLELLDIGCGFGELSIYFAVQGARVSAIDANGERLAVGRAVAESHGLQVTFETALADRLPFADDSFDIAVM